jgi:hypothetical protein
MNSSSSPAVDRLMIQFLAWIAAQPRTYAQAMEAWKSTCPRLSIWEDALAEELIRVDHEDPHVKLTPRGRAMIG